jgi:MoxR-like ATPase
MPPPPDRHLGGHERALGPSTAARVGAEGEVRSRIPDVAALAAALDDVDYLADPGLATALFLAVRMPQPLLLEGEPGVGKTEAAKALARVLDTPLFRLQCYEGIDSAEALYEWNHPRQLLGIRLAEARHTPLAEEDLFGRDYLLRRPLLRAIEHGGPRPAVLLLDEIDRADAEFEAFTFEVLAEAAVTVPEFGTIRASHPPVVVLTSNRTRDLHDALTRRCLYHWIDYPRPERVAEIVRRRVPGSAEPLALDAAAAVTRLRSLELVKPPGIAEVIDWVAALTVLGIPRLDAAAVEASWGSVLKNREDLELARGRGAGWLAGDGRA